MYISNNARPKALQELLTLTAHGHLLATVWWKSIYSFSKSIDHRFACWKYFII